MGSPLCSSDIFCNLSDDPGLYCLCLFDSPRSGHCHSPVKKKAGRGGQELSCSVSKDGSPASAAGQCDRGPEAGPAASEEDQRGVGRGEEAGAHHGEEAQGLQGVHSAQGEQISTRCVCICISACL